MIDPSPADAAARTIVVLGDASRLELIAKFAAAFDSTVRSDANGSMARIKSGGTTIALVTAAGDGIAAHAAVAARADAALLVVDATVGPTPILREHALISRQMKVPEVVIVLSRATDATDSEQAQLVDAEVREIVRLYFQPEETPRTMTADARAANGRVDIAARGVNAIADALLKPRASRADRPPPTPRKSARAVVYVLSRQEAFRREIAATVDNGPATVTFGGRPVAVEVQAPAPVSPAGNGEVTIIFPQPYPASSGDHFAVLKDDHIAAVGTIVAD